MVEWLHKHRRKVFLALIVAVVCPLFVFWGGYRGGIHLSVEKARPVARVAVKNTWLRRNSFVDITRKQFMERLNSEAGRIEKYTGKRPTLQDLAADGTAENVLNSMIDSLLLDRAERKDFGKRFSREFLIQKLKEMPAFQDESGKFSPHKWDGWLAQQKGDNWDTIYRDLSEQIGRELFFKEVTAAAHVPESELKKQFEDNHTKLQVKYIRIDPSITPTQEQIQAQYNKDPGKYATPEKRDVQFVAVALAASKTEGPGQAAPKQTIADVRVNAVEKNDLKAAADEAGLTVERAADITSGTPSIVGVAPSDMVTFEKAVSKLKKGAISDVIEGKENFYVALVTEIIPPVTQPLDKVVDKVKEDTINAIRASKERLEEMNALGKKIRDEAKSLQDIVTKFPDYQPKIKETHAFTRRDYLFQEGLDVPASRIFDVLAGKQTGTFAGPLHGFRSDLYFVELDKAVPPTADDWKNIWPKEEKTLQAEDLETKRADMFSDYLLALRDKAMQRDRIQINYSVLAQLLAPEKKEAPVKG